MEKEIANSCQEKIRLEKELFNRDYRAVLEADGHMVTQDKIHGWIELGHLDQNNNTPATTSNIAKGQSSAATREVS